MPVHVLVVASQEPSMRIGFTPIGIWTGLPTSLGSSCAWVALSQFIALARITTACGVDFVAVNNSSLWAFQRHHIRLHRATICSSFRCLVMYSMAAGKFNGRCSIIKGKLEQNHIALERSQKNSRCIKNSFSDSHLWHNGEMDRILVCNAAAVGTPLCTPFQRKVLIRGITFFHDQIRAHASMVVLS